MFRGCIPLSLNFLCNISEFLAIGAVFARGWSWPVIGWLFQSLNLSLFYLKFTGKACTASWCRGNVMAFSWLRSLVRIPLCDFVCWRVAGPRTMALGRGRGTAPRNISKHLEILGVTAMGEGVRRVPGFSNLLIKPQKILKYSSK